MISSIAWVPRGVAAQLPKVAEPTPEELASMKEQMENQQGLHDDDEDDDDDEQSESEDMDTSDEGEDGAVAHARAVAASLASGAGSGSKRSGKGGNTDSIEAGLKELDMEHYDSDDGTPSVVQRALGGKLEIHQGEDPYVTLPGDDDDNGEWPCMQHGAAWRGASMHAAWEAWGVCIGTRCSSRQCHPGFKVLTCVCQLRAAQQRQLVHFAGMLMQQSAHTLMPWPLPPIFIYLLQIQRLRTWRSSQQICSS
jgi:hypothetical protein